ncbi:hypothetical protein Tco_0290210 [Tanacetum coccineum]
MKDGAIELCDKGGNEFIMNRQRVKSYQSNTENFDKDEDIILDDQGGVTCVVDEVSFYTLFQALGWYLEEITHDLDSFGEETDKTTGTLYTKSLKKLCIQCVETASRVSNDSVSEAFK